MGGDTTWPGPVMCDKTRVSYDTVAVFNTVTGEWRNQTTTGDVPTGHEGSYSVGAPGNGTFEVCFLQSANDLSLPSHPFAHAFNRSSYTAATKVTLLKRSRQSILN